jgi:hypothetical protein
MLRWILRLLLLSPLLFGAALYWASEHGGETVVLETRDERGNSLQTTLWVVDLHDEPWLRAGDPEAAWLQRIEQYPAVFLIRDGERKPYRAEIAEESAWRVDEAMREKYAWADWIVSWIHASAGVVAIRLAEPPDFDS